MIEGGSLDCQRRLSRLLWIEQVDLHNTEYSKDHHCSRLRLSNFSLPASHFGFVNICLFLLEIEEGFDLTC